MFVFGLVRIFCGRRRTVLWPIQDSLAACLPGVKCDVLRHLRSPKGSINKGIDDQNAGNALTMLQVFAQQLSRAASLSRRDDHAILERRLPDIGTATRTLAPILVKLKS